MILRNKTNNDQYSSYIDQILLGKDENEKGFDKLAIETSHAAKFLCLLSGSPELIKKSEAPDFIVKVNDIVIGLEHEILVDQDAKQKEGTFKELIKVVEKEYRKKNPDKKLLINLYPNISIKIRKTEKDSISKKILKIIENYVTSKKLMDNEFIESISMMPHSRLDITCNLGAWWQKTIDTVTLENAIRKKDKKIPNYIKKTGLKEQWLLIVIGGVGDSSYEMDSNNSIMNHTFKSKFKRIFLMEDFRAKLYELVTS